MAEFIKHCDNAPTVFKGLHDAFSDGETPFGGRAEAILCITGEIVKLFPKTKFDARGTG